MMLAIISDIHGNLPALEKALNLIKKVKVDNYLFLGDVVGYGPWSNECVELISTLKNSFKIKGNHEDYYLKKKFNGKNRLTKKFFKESFYNFKRFDLIKEYKEEIIIDDIEFKHTIENKYIFSDTEINLKKNLVLGHSHQQFFKNIKQFWVLNPGSLGQNRKNINLMQYAILDTKTSYYKFFTEKHDIGAVIKKMVERKYPDDCIEYYKSRTR